MAQRITHGGDQETATYIIDVDIQVQWNAETIDYVGWVMGGNQNQLAGRDGGSGGGDSILGWRWNREHTMRVLRRLVPDVDALDGYAMSEEVMAAEYVALESAIRRELENLLGPNYPRSLFEDVVMEILVLMQLEMDRVDQSFLEEIGAEEEIHDELERRSRRHGTRGGADEEEVEMCSICLDGLYQENESIARLDCEHEYHVCCIKEWLVQGKNECPLCRGRALHTHKE